MRRRIIACGTRVTPKQVDSVDPARASPRHARPTFAFSDLRWQGSVLPEMPGMFTVPGAKGSTPWPDLRRNVEMPAANQGAPTDAQWEIGAKASLAVTHPVPKNQVMTLPTIESLKPTQDVE